jgi:hypothetical protein
MVPVVAGFTFSGSMCPGNKRTLKTGEMLVHLRTPGTCGDLLFGRTRRKYLGASIWKWACRQQEGIDIGFHVCYTGPMVARGGDRGAHPLSKDTILGQRPPPVVRSLSDQYQTRHVQLFCRKSQRAFTVHPPLADNPAQTLI